jgi:hypothetical protein
MGQSHDFWVVHFQYNVFSWPFSLGVFINFIAIKDKQIISMKVKDGRAKVLKWMTGLLDTILKVEHPWIITPINMGRFKCEKISTYDSQTIDAN